MEDIIDIYEPVYRESNYTLLIILIVISLLVAGFFIYKYILNRKDNVIENLYKKSLDSLVFLKGEIDRLPEKETMDRARIVLVTFLEALEGDKYSSYISSDIGNLLNECGFNNLGEIYKSSFDPVLYGKKSISKDRLEELLKETGEFITMKYRSHIDD